MSLAPEDIQQIKDLIASDIAKPTEPWSWSKFLLGIFNGRNYAKAIILGFCLLVVLVISFSVYKAISGHFAPQSSEQKIGTNQGIIATKNEDKKGNSVSLINLFNWR